MNIHKLSKLLRQSHKKTGSWNVTGKAFHMTGGMAYKIANQGYDPANPILRNALGLGARLCPKCKRKITVPNRSAKRIFDMSPKELLWRLEHRETIK